MNPTNPIIIDQFESTTPTEESRLKLEQFYEELLNSLREMIRSLYDSNSLNDICIANSVKQILSNFLKRKDILMIDIFAIFNSFRKNRMILIIDEIECEFRFSEATSLMFGRTRIEITIESKIMIDYLYHILESLPVSHQDLIWLLYTLKLREEILKKIFKERIDSFNITNFDLTITQSFTFWCDFFGNWETERNSLLRQCLDTFTTKEYLSNKQAKYLKKFNRRFNLEIESFSKCLNVHCSGHDFFEFEITPKFDI
jgi:hypothetical protein